MAHPSIRGGEKLGGSDEFDVLAIGQQEHLDDFYIELTSLVNGGPGVYAHAVQYGALQIEPYELATESFEPKLPAVQKRRVHGVRVTFDGLTKQDARRGILIAPSGNAWQTGFAVRPIEQNVDGTYRRLHEADTTSLDAVLGFFTVSDIERAVA